MNFNSIHKIHFLGIGGIGMSAIARYFISRGKVVSGYDKTETELTKKLIAEGIEVYYEDQGVRVLERLNVETDLVVYTPAIPKGFSELQILQENGFRVIKRAKALGVISSAFETYAVAGTHGKTTTSSILAHVLFQSHLKCNAFIGGISSNYNSNCIIDPEAKNIVVEADEFDRSFLELKPNYSIVTTMDADHLDIYGNSDGLIASFNEFVNLTNVNGRVLLQANIDQSSFEVKEGLELLTYGFGVAADWQGDNLKYEEGRFFFDILYQGKLFSEVEFGLPGRHNAENALAVFAMAYLNGVSEIEIRKAFKSYKGVKRRFDFHIRTEKLVVIDDYAHHPTEINALLSSIRTIYPGKKVTLIFQPHLFSRTRDFYQEFVQVLASSDLLYLLDIYPAREEPIPGVSSELLLADIQMTQKKLSTKSTIVEDLKNQEHEVVLIVGAGDIDTCIRPIVSFFNGLLNL
ncbi:UDP-N-acetylmuramate--L-alanine ligase [Crocinitomix algicola]|uniref:UDP-N-acetylmuramate--L-alanine ligase n=1 Tax=Crocinitomix algicola TaxID=1740263 RepID=UPI000871CB54|nr:UDP-N-acetylmuramate--L-alanine ligase [Crocinitomix algicola]